MKKDVLLSSLAQKQYEKIPTKQRAEIKKKLNAFAAGSKKKWDIKKLKGIDKREPLYRLRIGNWRIFYSPERKVIKVIRIEPRDKGYDWL